MACNIEQANKDIDTLLEYYASGNMQISEDMKEKLIIVKEQLNKAKQLKLEENKDNKSIENKTDDKNKNKSIEKELDDIIKTYMIDNKLKFDYKIEKGELGSIFLTMISDDDYDYVTTREIRKIVNEKFNNKDIIVDDDIIPFSVQQVLEQYKKDENIEKENKKLLEYIQDNVKYEINYSKQLAYDFFINKRNETGYYNPKLNVVTIADFDGLKNDEDMMRMLSIELINEADTGDKEIKIISDTVKSVINDIDAHNVTFKTKLHEAVHAAVKNYMDSKKGKAYSEEMAKMFEVVKQASAANPEMFKANKEYWKKDVDEFLAEALSDPEFIKDLMKIDTEGNLITGAKKSMFDKIIDMIVEALGLSKKEDKLNMHKYLLDSFKAAVEANRDGKEYISFKAPAVDIKNKYKGKIILVNAGGGKSYASRTNKNIFDGDDLLVEAANEITKDLGLSNFIKNVSEINDVWISWGKGNSEKESEYNYLRNKVYELQAEKAKEVALDGKTVLIASARKPILDIVDYVMFQNNIDTLLSNLSDKKRDNPLEFSKKELSEKIKKFEKNIEGKNIIYLDEGKFVLDELMLDEAPEGSVRIYKNKYKTINEEDIMQAKDIMLKNKEECR